MQKKKFYFAKQGIPNNVNTSGEEWISLGEFAILCLLEMT